MQTNSKSNNILAIDTCSNDLTVAIRYQGETVTEQINNRLKHSVTLLPTIENLLQSIAATLNDIEIFAATCGPGSYTGIRIGLSTITTLAYTQKKPCIGLSSLEVQLVNHLTTSEAESSIILSTIDARGGRIFGSLWQSKTDMHYQRLSPDRQFVDNELLTVLSHLQQQIPFHSLRIIGNGQETAQCILEQNLSLTTIPTPSSQLTGTSLIKLVDIVQERGLTEYPAIANYCALTQAERLKQQHEQSF